MSPEEADQRILLSQTLLNQYRRMVNELSWPLDDSPVFQKEIDVLTTIANEHPGKINQLISLVAQWAALQNGPPAKLH